jgi:glycosyltransferase involved in cell wall biosynthesis
MIAALDGTPLTLSSGGLRRYTDELVRSLRSEFPEDEYHVVSDQLTPPRNWLERRWWSIGLSRKLVSQGCEVFHGTDFAVPYLPLRPAVMTVHDVSPWRDPAWHHDARRVRTRTPYLIGLGLATMLIVPTNAVRREVIDLFPVPPDRVAVVPEAAAPHLVPSEPYSSRPYFLFVGTLEPRKNVPALVAAWNEMRRRHDVDLILAGRRRQDGPQFAPQDGLLLLSEVNEQDLRKLYSGAVALVYPSFYEGFGLPLLEAMQCGTPVIASPDPAVVEVCGNAAIHTSDLARAMEALLLNTEERCRRRELSIKRAADFSWSKTARLTREVYVEAIRRFGY